MKLALVSSFLALIIACTSTSVNMNGARVTESERSQQSGINADEYAVYSALFEKLYARPQVSSATVVMEPVAFVFKKSDLDATLKYVSQNVPDGLATDLIEDLKHKNGDKDNLVNRFYTSVKVDLITQAEVDKLYQNGGWARFFETHPHGTIITFSRVGFTKDHKQGLVYTGTQSGGKSGAGYYLLLTREGDTWNIKNKIEVWVS